MDASDSTSGVSPVVTVAPVEETAGLMGVPVKVCGRAHPLKFGGVFGRRHYGRMHVRCCVGKFEGERRAGQHGEAGAFGPTR